MGATPMTQQPPKCIPTSGIAPACNHETCTPISSKDDKRTRHVNGGDRAEVQGNTQLKNKRIDIATIYRDEDGLLKCKATTPHFCGLTFASVDKNDMVVLIKNILDEVTM
jgi:hypothetical protein